MNLQLIRAAVLAATRIVQDGSRPTDLREAVKEAHVSLFDTEIGDSVGLPNAADLAGDLVNFAAAVRAAK